LDQPDRSARIADGPEQDRVHALDLLEGRVGEDLARLEVVLAAERVGVVVELEAVDVGRRVEDLELLGRHFRTDAVAGDHCDVELLHGGGGPDFSGYTLTRWTR